MHRSLRYIALSTLIGALLIGPTVASAASETVDLPPGHSMFTSVVTKKAGALVVTTPNGRDASAQREHGATSRAEAVQSGG